MSIADSRIDPNQVFIDSDQVAKGAIRRWKEVNQVMMVHDARRVTRYASGGRKGRVYVDEEAQRIEKIVGWAFSTWNSLIDGAER